MSGRSETIPPKVTGVLLTPNPKHILLESYPLLTNHFSLLLLRIASLPPLLSSINLFREREREEREKDMVRPTKETKARAEVYYGDETCREKSTLLLTEMGLPNWLLPFDQDIKEFGYVIDTGFVWLKQRHRREHRIEEVEGKVVVYDSEITAYVEPKKIKKLTGVKAKELFIWITLSEIYVDGSRGTITFKTPSGLSRSFAVAVSA